MVSLMKADAKSIRNHYCHFNGKRVPHEFSPAGNGEKKGKFFLKS
jgi:hypothetical protein